MRPSSPRSSRISSTTARYSVSSSRIRASDSSESGRSSTSTRSVPCASVVAAPATPRCSPLSATARPPGQAHAIGHLGDDADARIVVVVAWDEQHLLLRPDVHGQGHVHVREDHEVLQGDEQHRAQAITPCTGFFHTSINYKKRSAIPNSWDQFPLD